jgi:hypothetical protein
MAMHNASGAPADRRTPALAEVHRPALSWIKSAAELS